MRLLSPTRGIFNGFAFGGNRSRRRFVGCLDPLSHVLFTIGSNKTGTYTVLEEGTLLNNFPAVRKDSARTGLAVNCIKFVEAVEIDPSDAKPAYELLLETLAMLEEGGGNSELTPWLFRAKLAFDMGYSPDFLRCGTCGRAVGNDDGYRFGVEKGQVACRTCLSDGKPLEGLARPVSPGVLQAFWTGCGRAGRWTGSPYPWTTPCGGRPVSLSNSSSPTTWACPGKAACIKRYSWSHQ